MKDLKTSYLTSRRRLIQWKPIPESKWCSQNGQYIIKYRPIDGKSQSRRKTGKRWTTVTVDRNQNEYKLDYSFRLSAQLYQNLITSCIERHF